MIEAIAHRGSHTHHPENTVPAILTAIDEGADGIEIDVHRTRDDHVVVHHDFFPRGRCDNPKLRSRPLADLTYDELSQFDLGGGVRIPKLTDLLDAIDSRAALYVEIKGPRVEDALASLLGARHRNRVIVHGFDHRVVRKLAKLLPDVPRGILQGSYLIDNCAPLVSASARDLWEHMELIDGDLVEEIHACGARVIAWTANAERDWQRLAGFGVDAICTDTVAEFIRWRTAWAPS